MIVISGALVLVASARVPQDRGKPTVVYTVNYLKPPDTLQALWDEAGAVVRVTVHSGEPKAHKLPHAPNAPRVFTKYLATVTDTIKWTAETPQGAQIRIIQSAGTLDLEDKRVTVRGGYEPFKPQCDYILFLEWNDSLGGFEVLYGPSSTFEIVNGLVETPATNGPAVLVRGASVERVLTQLKALR